MALAKIRDSLPLNYTEAVTAADPVTGDSDAAPPFSVWICVAGVATIID
jgi:hypothetical protein